MRRHWWLVTLAVLLLGFTALWSLYTVATRPGRFINRDALERIEIGMTAKEVEAILGSPPGDHTVFKRVPAVDARGEVFLWTYPTASGQTWASDEGVLFVLIQDDKVVRREFEPSVGASRRDFLDVLGRLLAGAQ